MSSKRKSPHGGDNGNESVKEIWKGQKAGLTSQLAVARLEEADRKRMDRRKAWREEVRRELGKREEFKEEMESVPLEDVEVEEKPLLSRLSLWWREAFKNDRVGFLFPEAFRAMMSSELATLASCLPMMPGELSQLQSKYAQVLLLRLVSKSVKEAIDDLHSNVMPKFYGGFRSVSITMLEAANITKRFDKGVNPFFFHRLRISPSCYDQLPEFWKESEAILARWGKEVWSASIQFSVLSKDAETPDDYDLLVAYLKLMPNLRRLFISGRFDKMELNKLKERIATNPLPELPYLRFVRSYESASKAESVPAIITYSLLSRYSRNLETIQLYTRVPLPLEGNFPSLQKLKLCFLRIETMDDLVDMNLFKGLNNWGIALKELTLTVMGIIGYRHEVRSSALNELFLELHHLETLSLDMHYLPLETLDILLPCKSLKTLIYSADQYHDDLDPWAPHSDEGIFQFPDPSNIYESNIWKLLPELKLIDMDITTYAPNYEYFWCQRLKSVKKEQYTREGYQQHCRLQNVQKDASSKGGNAY